MSTILPTAAKHAGLPTSSLRMSGSNEMVATVVQRLAVAQRFRAHVLVARRRAGDVHDVEAKGVQRRYRGVVAGGAHAHDRSLLPLAPPSFGLDVRGVDLTVEAGKILRWTFAAARGWGARNCHA